MRKKLLALLLALAMTAALTACGNRRDPAEEEPSGTETAEPAQGTEGLEDSAIATDIVDIDELETGEPAPELGSRPADLNEKTEGGNLPADTAQKPAGSQISSASKADLAAFYETVSAGEDWPAMMQAEGEILDAFYPGLSDIATNQCGVYTAMISAAVGEIALVEVQDAGDVQKVKDIFQARIDYQVGDDTTPGGAWYPETIEGWKNGSRIVSNGNFVMLVALNEGADGVVDSFNALFS